MGTMRDHLRSLTLGAPQRQLRRTTVAVRDASKPRVREVELDDAGQPVLEQQVGDDKQPLFDDLGQPVMRQKTRLRHPVALNERGEPELIEVREPTVKQRSAILKAAGAGTDKYDAAAFQVETVIACSFEPGSNTKLFDEKDRPALLALPAGSFLDDIFEVAVEFMNVDEEELEKNSAGTASA